MREMVSQVGYFTSERHNKKREACQSELCRVAYFLDLGSTLE